METSTQWLQNKKRERERTRTSKCVSEGKRDGWDAKLGFGLRDTAARLISQLGHNSQPRGAHFTVGYTLMLLPLALSLNSCTGLLERTISITHNNGYQ